MKIYIKRFNGSSWDTIKPVTDWDNIENKVNATTSAAGLMSSTDKTRVDNMWAALNGTNSTTIDTIAEVYSFLSDYAQTTDLATLLANKVSNNDSRLSDARNAADVYAWAKASTKPSYTHNEIGEGALTVGDGANYILLRSHTSWRTGLYYHTNGNEALVFGNTNANTSFIFANVDPASRPDWTGISTGVQIKKASVMINKILGNDVNPSYNLDVNGTANATTLYESGTSLTDKYAAKSHTHSYLPLSGGAMTGNISYQGTKATYPMIKWIDNTSDTYGNGISIGGGGLVVIGAGEASDTIVSGASLSGGTEDLYLGADTNIYFKSNCQSNYSSAKTMTFDSNGNLAVPGTITSGGTTVLTSHQDISGKADKASVTAGWYRRVYVNAQGIVTQGDQTDTDTNTWRPVSINGTVKINDRSTNLNFIANGSASVAFDEDTNSVVIGATDTNTWRPLGTGSDQAAAGNHTHTTIVGSYTTNGGQQNPNYFGTNRVGALMMNTTVNGNSQYKDWLFMDCYNGSDVGGGVAIGVNRQSLGLYIMRSAAARSSWAESAELIGTHNISIYVKDWARAANKPSYTFTGSAVTSGANSGSAVAAVTAINAGSGGLEGNTTASGGIPYVEASLNGTELTLTVKYLHHSHTGASVKTTANAAPNSHTHSVTASGSVS